MADTIEALVAALAAELRKNQPETTSPVPVQAGANGSGMSAQSASSTASSTGKRSYTVSDYPMLEKHGGEIRTPTGKAMGEITLDAVLDGKIGISDVRISKEMLEAQAQIAADAGKPAMGENLLRAAELTAVPDDEVIRMYDRLRPNRSTKAELDKLAAGLEQKYGAVKCAELVREAASVYEKRGILRA